MSATRRWSSRIQKALSCVAMIAILAGSVHAQSDTGRIEGVVADAQGASITGASVSAVNVLTNERFEATTNDDGFYVITPLKVGTYKLEVSATAFKKYERPDIVLQVNQIARIDADLSPGDISEVVEITGGAPLVEASSSSLSQVIEAKKIVDLPLNGRNFTQLATLVPGVNRGTTGGIATGQANNTETFRQQENGGASLSANGLREQNNNFQLDGIDNNEVIVNTVVFFPPVEALQEFRVITSVAPAEFGRGGGAVINAVIKSGSNDIHGSVFEFIRNSALDARPTYATRKEVFIRNQYGFTIGGPIFKDKTFFFGDWQGLRQRLPVEAGNRVTVPTALMRQGNFSELLNPALTGFGGPVQIVNPDTGDPFPNNVIPSNLLNPAGLALLNAYPLPTEGGVIRNFEPNRVRQQKFDDGDVRIDHRFNDNNTIFGRFSIARDRLFDAGRLVNTFQAGFGAGTNRVGAESFAFNYTTIVSNAAVNEFRFGYIHNKIQFLPIGFDTNQNAELGIPGASGIDVFAGISLIGGGDGRYLEYVGSGGEFRLNERSFQVSDAFTWTKGNHTFKFGATLIRRRVEGLPSDFAEKGFYFFSDLLATPGTAIPAGQTGYEVADILVGRTNFTVADRFDLADPPTTLNWENGFFAQDDWRVNRRITLNLGLRYDVYPPYVEKNDRLANFDPTTRTLVLPGQNGASRATVDTDWNNFGPRLGVAIDLTGDTKTILRGGYGTFYSIDRGGVDNQLVKNPPFFVQNYIFGGPGGAIRINEPIPQPPAVDPTNPSGIPNGNTVRYVPIDTRNTIVHQYNVTFERQLSDDLAATVAYVGTSADNVLAITTAGGTFAPTLEGRVTTIANVAASHYNSLQIKLNQREWHGWSYLASYTFGKAIDNAAGPFPGPNVASRSAATDPNNLDLDKGATGYDVRHRFTFATTYEIGGFDDASKPVQYIFGDWQVNSIITLQSGDPFTVYGGFNRAQITGDPYGSGGPDRYLDPTAFRDSTGPDDQMERNSLYGPGHYTVDASLFRRFNVNERVNIEFRAEAFNLFNTPQFATPVVFRGDGNFGRILSTIGNTERQLQFGLRVIF